MKLLVRPSRLSGKVRAPPSKSYTHRAFIIAALAEGESRIHHPLLSLDTQATIEGIKALGARVERKGEAWIVRGTGGQVRAKQREIDALNSGTTLRILAAVGALSPAPIRLTGDRSLLRRPMGPLIDALKQLGAEAKCQGANGRPPVVVGGGLEGGETEITGTVSSQFISALLIAGTQAREDVEITITDELRSKPYVEITLDLLRKAGARIKHDKSLMWFKVEGRQRLKPLDIEIPGDFSSASFVLGGAALTGSCVEVDNLNYRGVQGDRRIVDYLREFGAEVEVKTGAISVRGSELSGSEFDCADTPDLVPVLAVLGSIADGTTEIRNVPHLRIKESDRIRTLTIGLERLGARVKELEDGLKLFGRKGLTGNTVDSYGDHRIAMALTIAGLVATGQTLVSGAESIPVSYPGFVDDLKKLGARIEIITSKP